MTIEFELVKTSHTKNMKTIIQDQLVVISLKIYIKNKLTLREIIYRVKHNSARTKLIWKATKRNF